MESGHLPFDLKVDMPRPGMYWSRAGMGHRSYRKHPLPIQFLLPSLLVHACRAETTAWKLNIMPLQANFSKLTPDYLEGKAHFSVRFHHQFTTMQPQRANTMLQKIPKSQRLKTRHSKDFQENPDLLYFCNILSIIITLGGKHPCLSIWSFSPPLPSKTGASWACQHTDSCSASGRWQHIL